ncbi:hypothetical protein GGR56DRAFT_671220 [Xylariaceae sp. FL0804]|nr:hypothetical protein GGR56DRAFT_671220 [Xylariaceae sp. FL0804]
MAPRQTVLPLAYRLFFLVVEPISALVGAYFAHFRQAEYLAMTEHHPYSYSSASSVSSAAEAPSPGASVALSQLANLYLLFALNEALVLRATGDRRVWRALLLGELVADLGHLYALRSAGAGAANSVYWDVASWNPMDWGNVPFVYLGASMRIAFLCGVGLGGGGGGGGGGSQAR